MTNFNSYNNTLSLKPQEIIQHLKSVLPSFENISTLKHHSVNKKTGSCPLCGGDDRFYLNVAEQRGYCTHCTPKGEDLTGWHCLINNKKHPSELLELYPMNGDGVINSYPITTNTPTQTQPQKTVEDVRKRWQAIISNNHNRQPVLDLLVSKRMLSGDIVNQYFDSGKFRYEKHVDKDSVAVPFFSLQGKRINGGCEFAPPELMALQFITVDGEAFPFTVDKETGKGNNKVFQSGSTHSDGFFQAGIEFNKAVSEGKGIVIVEGVIDALTVAQCVPDVCCLATGSTVYTKKIEHLKPYIRRVGRVIVFQDNDKAGEKFAQSVSGIMSDKKISPDLGKSIGTVCKVQWSPDDKDGFDPNDLLKSGQSDRIRQMIDGAIEVVKSIHQSDELILDAVEVKALKPVQMATNIKHIVKLIAGRQPEIIKECEKILLDTGGIFQKGKNLFRISKEKRKTHKGISQGDSYYLQEITSVWLKNRLNQLVSFTGFKDKNEIQKDCPKDLAESILANSGAWPFPFILGISETPTLRLDGSVIQKQGYDEHTGLFMAIDNEWNIPEHPTKEDALKAYDKLAYIIKDFEFTDEESKTAVISAMLTGVTRRLLPTAPAFCFDAPKRGSGKTLLADTIGTIITGGAITTMNMGNNEEEFEKRMGVILFRGEPAVLIDNVERPVSGELVCSMLTKDETGARILGQSEMPKCATNILIMFTGNNTTFKGDMVRRVLISRIDPKCENPEDREFTTDLREYAQNNRRELVTSALTIVRAYHVAGCPKLNITNYGSFETWCKFARNPLVWLGKVDPCKSREKVKDYDPVTGNLKELLEAWYGVYGKKEITARTVAEDIKDKSKFAHYSYSAISQASKDRLIEIVEDIAMDNNGNINPKRLGNFIAKHRDRIEGNFKFIHSGDFRKASKYCVVNIDTAKEENTSCSECSWNVPEKNTCNGGKSRGINDYCNEFQQKA